MFCQKCGASVPEGAKFCENCGSPVTAAPKPPVQQANPQPGYQQPYAPTYQPPANRQQGYQPYAPTYQPTVQPAEKRSIAPMIAPIVLAGLSMLLCFISWVRGSQNGSQNIEYFAESIGYDFANFFTLMAVAFTDLLLLLASLFFFLYGLVQYKKGRTSLFGVACLMFFVSVVLGALSSLAWLIYNATEGYSVNPWSVIRFILLVTSAVMLLIGAINGFRGKIKVFPVIGAGLFFLCDLISFLNNRGASNGIALAASTLLFVAILLIAIFAKPKDE